MKIKITQNKTNQLTVKGLVNGKEALFVVDTGASASTIDEEWIDKLDLQLSKKTEELNGVGASGIQVNFIEKLEIELEGKILKTQEAVSSDLSHVNESLKRHGVEPIAGIIGADILMRYKGVINYNEMTMKLAA